MRSFKKFGVLIAVFALSAIGAANASAASFTASATGSLSGKATETNVFTTSAGQVKCTTAATSGNITETTSEKQEVEVKYSGCTAFGFANVHISPAKYLFTANKSVHVLNTITINVTVGSCHITVTPQTPTGTVDFDNHGNALIVTPHVTGIHYETTPSSGTLCGSTGTNGTYTGASTVERVGGGSIDHDA